MSLNKFDLILTVARLLDRLNSCLADHHLRTACLADQLSLRLNLDPRERRLVLLSALVHDVGLTPLGLRSDDLPLEEDFDLHARVGGLMLRTCPRLNEEAQVVSQHHANWAALRHLPRERRRAGELGNLIRLADYLDISARLRSGPRALSSALKGLAGDIFGPHLVEAARDLLLSPDLFPGLSQAALELSRPEGDDLALNDDEVSCFAFLISRLVDSRSPFTAMHSVMTAGLSCGLHQMAGGREEDTRFIYVAGLLHDLGMLGVPLGSIEKQGTLNREEFARVSEHAALTYQALSGLPGLERVAAWAAFHHERLDGGGYPWGLSQSEIELEARIIAVADVLAALTEHRPHRRARSTGEALKVLGDQVKSRALDGDLVELVRKNTDYFSALQHHTYTESRPFFKGLIQEINRSVRGRLSTAWQHVLDCPYPLAA